MGALSCAADTNLSESDAVLRGQDRQLRIGRDSGTAFQQRAEEITSTHAGPPFHIDLERYFLCSSKL
jgi:hypothetical protein